MGDKVLKKEYMEKVDIIHDSLRQLMDMYNIIDPRDEGMELNESWWSYKQMDIPDNNRYIRVINGIQISISKKANSTSDIDKFYSDLSKELLSIEGRVGQKILKGDFGGRNYIHIDIYIK